MRAAWLIAVKDLRLRIRDRSAIVVGVLAPLGLAFIFNLVLGPIVEGDFVPPYTVVDADGGPVAAGFVEMMDSIEQQGVIELVPSADAGAAEALVADGSVATAVIIPSGFSAAVQSGQAATLRLIGNTDDPVSTDIARSIAAGFASEVLATQLAVATAVATSNGEVSPAEIQRLADIVVLEGSPIALGRIDAATRELDIATFFAAAMSVFFLFFTVSFGVNGLLEERNQGTIARLLAAPIPQSQIILGKALVSFILGLVSMTVLITASSLLLGASWGNPVGVAILVVAGVFAATGLMTVVAAFAKTPEQAGNLQAILSVSLGMLGGIFFPTSLGTGFLANLAYISPHRWFLTGLGDLAGGGALSGILPSVLGLVAFGLLGWALSAVRFRKGISL